MGCSNVKEKDVIAMTNTMDDTVKNKAKAMNESDEDVLDIKFQSPPKQSEENK